MVAVIRFSYVLSTSFLLLALSGNAQSVEIAAPYVPTAPSVVERMLAIAKVRSDDYVIDLVSGDGRIVITAARKYGARALGIEIDPQLVAQATANAQAAGVSDRVSFREADLFTADLSAATVVTIYLLTRATMKLQSRLFDLKPGTRIVTNASSMGDWKPDHFEMFDVRDKVRPDAPKKTYIQFWVVPAKVAGTWRWSVPVGNRSYDYEVALSQHFQVVSGAVRVGTGETRIEKARLVGDHIMLGFTAQIDGKPLRHRLSGRVAGESLVGTVSIVGADMQEEAKWHAARVASPTN